MFSGKTPNQRHHTSAVATAGMGNRDTLHQGDTLRGAPITQDGKTDGFRAIPSYEVGIATVGKGGAMSCFIPTADETLEFWIAFHCHDERNHRLIAAHDVECSEIC